MCVYIYIHIIGARPHRDGPAARRDGPEAGRAGAAAPGAIYIYIYIYTDTLYASLYNC